MVCPSIDLEISSSMGISRVSASPFSILTSICSNHPVPSLPHETANAEKRSSSTRPHDVDTETINLIQQRSLFSAGMCLL